MMVKYIETYARDKGVSETRLEGRLSITSNVAFYKKLNYEIIEKHAYPAETDYLVRNEKLIFQLVPSLSSHGRTQLLP